MYPGDPVVGSTILRRPAIQSPNYVAGSAGWTINVDGSAEFNNLTIRGTFTGTDFYMDGTGAFFYSGVPAAGNLSFSITPAGTNADKFGNAIPSDGANAYTFLAGPSVWSAITIGDGVLSWWKAATQAGPWTGEAGVGFTFNAITGGGLTVTAAAGVSFSNNLTVGGNLVLTIPLAVTGSSATAGLTNGQISNSSATAGLTNGTINGTSGGASAGTAHTHGAGSYAVANGQHSHGAGTYAVTDGTHSHGAGSYAV